MHARKWPTWALALLGVAVGLVCEGQASATPCKPTVPQMQALIVKHGQGGMRRRRVVARQLAKAVWRESRRWRLDPIAMLAVASVESDFRANIRGKLRPGSRRSAEVGVWQLIPGDSPVRAARRTLARLCKAKKCPHRRRSRRRFSVTELAQIPLGTWIFSHELTAHVRACKRRQPRGHTMPLSQPRWLARWAHYNTGPRTPTTWYRYKLARQYRLFRRALCGGAK